MKVNQIIGTNNLFKKTLKIVDSPKPKDTVVFGNEKDLFKKADEGKVNG